MLSCVYEQGHVDGREVHGLHLIHRHTASDHPAEVVALGDEWTVSERERVDSSTHADPRPWCGQALPEIKRTAPVIAGAVLLQQLTSTDAQRQPKRQP